MDSVCGFVFIFLIPVSVRLFSLSSYYLSAFTNITSYSGFYNELLSTIDCSDDYDTEFMDGFNGYFVFGLFVVSMVLNVIGFIYNSIGFYKLYSSKDECPVYFLKGTLFAILSVLFWAPGNYSSRIFHEDNCALVEGIMVHLYNLPCFNFIIASWAISMVAVISIYIMGAFNYKCKNIPLIFSGFYLILLFYTFLFFLFSIIMILWCTWVYQLPWTVFFTIELIAGFIILCRLAGKDKGNVEDDGKVIFIFIRSIH